MVMTLKDGREVEMVFHGYHDGYNGDENLGHIVEIDSIADLENNHELFHELNKEEIERCYDIAYEQYLKTI
jgi:hypothetical protein